MEWQEDRCSDFISKTMGQVMCHILGCEPEEGMVLSSRGHRVAGEINRIPPLTNEMLFYMIQIHWHRCQHLEGDSTGFLRHQNYITLCYSTEQLSKLNNLNPVHFSDLLFLTQPAPKKNHHVVAKPTV